MINITRYSISELADQAQVSPRTIRYYTEIGLLPEPQPDGKYTVYNEDHLNRLKLIAHLKNSYLPLKEIRQYLAGKSEHDIELEVNSTRVYKQDNAELFFSGGSEIRELSSASEYLSSILTPSKGEPNATPAPTELIQPKSLADRGTFNPRATHASTQVEPAADKDGEHWERYTLTEGVELSVRLPLEPKVRAEVETLLGLARKLFRGKPGRK